MLLIQQEDFNFVRMMEFLAIHPDVFDIFYYSIASDYHGPANFLQLPEEQKAYHASYFPKVCNRILDGQDCSPYRNESLGQKEV